jgi:hypothetical protein
LDDITVTGGSLTQFIGSSKTYTAVFTPNDNFTGEALISVASSAFADSSGNLNVDKSELVFSVDTTSTSDNIQPMVIITASDQYLTNGEASTVYLRPTESIVSLGLQDIIVQGGALSDLQFLEDNAITYNSGFGYYTATFTPDTTFDTATIELPSGTIQDHAGNSNRAGNTLVFTLDNGI